MYCLPERIGWMPLKKTEMASKGVKLDTASMTSESVVKALLNPTLNINTIALNIILMMILVPFTTSTANFATDGCPAPSSLLTLTLHTIIVYESHIKEIKRKKLAMLLGLGYPCRTLLCIQVSNSSFV